MVRLALVAALLAALCAVVSAQQSYQGEACPWYQIYPAYFNATAFLPLFQFSACQQYKKEACCKVTYSDRVFDRQDEISKAVWGRLDFPSSSIECRRLVQMLACLPCSPYSDSVATVNEFATTIRICNSFCTKFYDLCGDTGIVGSENDTVSTTYTSGLDFCYNLLTLADWHVDVRTLEDDTCFADKPECTREDYVGEYTPCSSNGTRSVFWAKREDSDCEAGLPLPAPIHGLPCRVACNAGSYLPVGQKACRQCPAGYFSVGGGRRIENFAEAWPEEWDVESFCSAEGESAVRLECGWVSSEDGDFITSGKINDSMSSVIEIRALFVRPGTVRFSYKVDAEPNFDGLIFYIDNLKAMNLTSNTNGFEMFSADISAGYHRFRWRYAKDMAISEGEDQAQLRMIEFEGTSWADDLCTPCPVGQFSRIGAVDCIPCRANFFANETGTAQCSPCPDGTYSYEESSECTPKPECTTDDYASFVTPCQNNMRTRTYRWTQPQICDPDLPLSVTLPADQSIACAPCPSGTVSQGSDCVPCAEGFARSYQQTDCTPCPAGSAAIKSQHFHTWDEWDSTFWDTFCEGECGTDGWRLLSEYADSGVGHGHSVSSILRLKVSLNVRGTLTFNATMMCESCTLEVEDVGYSAWSFGPSLNGQKILDMRPGDHTVLFKFEKYDPHRENRNDRVVLYMVAVDGTKTGGARSCVQCAGGTYAPAQSALCYNCSAGSYSTPGAGRCQNCPANTFSDAPGAASCFPCGTGSVIQTPAGSTECLFDCKYSNGGFDFDLSTGLASTEDMWGPVYDSRDHAYMFNPCSIAHQNHSCFDTNGDPIKTFVCQVTNIGLGMDLGSVIGYSPLPSGSPSDGLVVTYTHGTPGCANSQPDRQPRFRTTNITFLCDPDAGVGMPAQPNEVLPCVYAFTWYSHYACPLCSENDYAFFLGPCDPDHGTRRKVYYWLNNPRRCHDGVGLPPPENIACTAQSSIQCAAGTYLPTSATDCSPALPGYYTTGPDDIWWYWNADALTNNGIWNTTCSGQGCTGWQVTSDGLLKSGELFSVLKAQVTYEKGSSGSLIFQYKYGHSNRSDFDVLLNGNSVWQLEKDIRDSSDYAGEWNSVTLRGLIGTQIISFVFSAGNAQDFIILKSVAFNSMRNNVAYPTPCPPGYWAPNPGSTGCMMCGPNTRSNAAASSCTACAANEYAMPGSSECTVRPSCTAADWEIVWTPCVAGLRNGTYTLVPPAICRTTGAAPSPIINAQCPPCPLGTIGIAGQCEGCPAGQYYDVPERRCASIPSGYVSLPVLSAWSPLDSDTFPPGWTTNCTGICATPGWRPRGRYIDSGLALSHEVDSKLTFTFSMVAAGTLTFDYVLAAEQLDGTSFVAIVDGVSTDLLPFNGVMAGIKIPLSATTTRVDFLHHIMPFGSPAILGNVSFTGIQGGYKLMPTACPAGTQNAGVLPVCQQCLPGTFADKEATGQCANCPPNTYAPSRGATMCIKCGDGTVASAGSKSCMTPGDLCKFTNTQLNETYDLSSLQGNVFTPSNKDTIHFTICSAAFTCGTADLTYACQTLDNAPVDIGRRLSFTPGTTTGSFSLTYDMGDECNNVPIASTIRFTCANDTNSKPFMTSTNSDVCLSKYEFSWRTQYACRTCRPEDYDRAVTPCSDSLQKIALVLRPDVLCNGPARLSEVEAECVEEIPVRPWYMLIAVALLLVLVIIIVFVVLKNRSLEHRYTQLSAIGARTANIGGPDTLETTNGEGGNPKEVVEHEDL